MEAQARQRHSQMPSAGEVRAHLGRLLASGAFPATARGRKLLEYVVEQTLAGRGERLKAYDLAVSVLGRDFDFDAQSDPIIRIEMRRLRRDLEHHYLGEEGRAESIRITIPKGRYVPDFEAREQELAPEPALPVAPPPRRFGRRGARLWRAGGAAGIGLFLLVAVVGAWLAWPVREQAQNPGPTVVVVPFESVSAGEDGQLLAEGLTAGLIADLIRFDGIRVFTGRSTDQAGVELPPAAAGGLAYVIAGTAERDVSRIRVTARLIEHESGQVLWSKSYDRALSTDDLFDVHADLSAAIVGELAQSYGVINLDAAKRLRQSRPASLVAYECVQRAFAYRRKFAKELYPPVRACLEEAVTRDPEYATAWAMLAFAHLDAVRFGFTETGTEAHEMTTGLVAAERAVALAPSSVTALQSLAALRYGNGEFDEAERVQRQAIALNPNDPESLAQLGWRLAVHGRWGEGGTLLQQAIARTVLVPDWYNMTLALALYLDGDFKRARDAAERGKGLCCGLGYATLALTEAALGHSAAARAALDEALRQSPLLARDPTKFWGNFQISNDVITRLNAGLAMAGLRLPPSSRGANLD